MWFIYTMEYYSSIKNKKLLILKTTWISLKMIILKVNQIQKIIYSIALLIKNKIYNDKKVINSWLGLGVESQMFQKCEGIVCAPEVYIIGGGGQRCLKRCDRQLVSHPTFLWTPLTRAQYDIHGTPTASCCQFLLFLGISTLGLSFKLLCCPCNRIYNKTSPGKSSKVL